jgi:hypothetical protein
MKRAIGAAPRGCVDMRKPLSDNSDAAGALLQRWWGAVVFRRTLLQSLFIRPFASEVATGRFGAMAPRPG